jgi:hypothetical protein
MNGSEQGLGSSPETGSSLLEMAPRVCFGDPQRGTPDLRKTEGVSWLKLEVRSITCNDCL